MSSSLRNKLFAVLIILVIIITYQITLRLEEVPQNGWVIIGNHSFVVDIANNENLRARGLSFRDDLNKDSGMIFVFEEAGYPSFWMKDMNFSIDIIWIDENLKISGIEKNLSPETYPEIYRPKTKTPYVLETTGGRTEELGIETGTPVIINLGNQNSS